MNTTIKEIAEKARVSIATVSRALNGNPKVKPDTKELIIALANQLDYKPNIMARNLVKKRANTIGIILPEAVDDFFTEIIKGIDEIAYAGNYITMVAGTHSERSMAESVINFMGRGVVEGIIVMSPSMNEPLKEILKKSDTPIVLISSKNELDKYDSVGIDNFQGAYSMVEYLIKAMGYKKIAHISGPILNNDAIERQIGYTQALRNNGIEVREDWIISGDFSIKNGEYACRRLLSLLEKPDIIFAGNDMMALGCYKAIESFGLKIPDDIGIVGYDDIFISQFLTPRLTTVHVPIVELGRTAASLLMHRIANGSSKEAKHIKISTGIVVGNSCRPVN
ncbi:MAG: LacI family DNA-binding transcriptional regulator [Bacteroidota bacterium]|nr:LacI family DNA-binding transcriptional regulator [Bacteroidota bacterium]